ncbi:hypothetical protein [Nostoc sp.]|uniref:hypothetical protein n=1 Tax=Nostoc sp. TaxID=1180 RepID=UPI002FEEA568
MVFIFVFTVTPQLSNSTLIFKLGHLSQEVNIEALGIGYSLSPSSPPAPSSPTLGLEIG